MVEKTLAELVAIDVDQYSKELSGLENPDERISKMLEYMQVQLSHGELHPLSRFWKMRKFCLDHFKETIPVSKRLRLWEKYRLVIDEIMKLKQMMDEKSAFEKEQIEDALLSIEHDVENIEALIENEHEISVPKAVCLEKNISFYKSSQKALNVYSSYAKRLNGLKKEILSLDISFKKKQEILDQIHKISDKVFPKKRELLTDVSHKYVEDMHSFCKANFSTNQFKTPVFSLKDQIKQLQNFAKILSLNVDAFSKTRELLSNCWDKLKEFEVMQKKIKDEKKQISDQNFQNLKKKLEDLTAKKASLEKETFSGEVKLLRNLIEKEDLLKFHKKQLEDEINIIDDKKLIKGKSSDEQLAFDALQSEVQNIHDNVKHWDYQTLDSQIKNVLNQSSQSNLLESKQIKMEREIYSLKEVLSTKLIEEIKDRIDVEEMSHEIESFKESLKKEIEVYRKILSSSNQSIEKAIVYNELIMLTRGLLSNFEKELTNFKSKT